MQKRLKITGMVGSYSMRVVSLALSMLFLASCRLVISTDETGHITSASGAFDCDQPSCVIGIEEPFVETFTAVPAEGYRFAGWSGVCEPNVIHICRVTLVPLPEEFMALDGDIEFSAIFEPTSTRRIWYRDNDGDHYGTPERSTMAFEKPPGFANNKLDCDDANADTYPRADELADGLDNDCDGRVDEGLRRNRFFIDRDGDGFGDPAQSRLDFTRPAGYVDNELDCNDDSDSDYPGAEELADDRDNDCDGRIDEGMYRYYPDVDGDGYGAGRDFIESLESVPGYVRNDDDCDDNNSAIHPGARELFDSADNDCDGDIDEGFSTREYFRDADGDGYGDPSNSVIEVEIPTGYVGNDDDNCPDIRNPSQADTDRDGIGDACDPFTDSDRDQVQDSADNCPARYNPSQADVDGDGLGDACDSQNGLDLDNDGINADVDNCPNTYNPGQSDSDGDGLGDACDAVDDGNDGVTGGGVTGSCSLSAEEQSMLAAVNAVRAQARTCGSYGSFPTAPALSWSCKLESAALGHSMDMANNNFFSHTGSDGRSVDYRVSQAGYSWSAVGENIAAGVPLSAVSAVVQAWVDSPGHCANLMRSSYTELGAAKFSNASSSYNVYWTQVFARPR